MYTQYMSSYGFFLFLFLFVLFGSKHVLSTIRLKIKDDKIDKHCRCQTTQSVKISVFRFILTYSLLRAPSCSIFTLSVEFQRHIVQVIRQHLYRKITVREAVSSGMEQLYIARGILRVQFQRKHIEYRCI